MSKNEQIKVSHLQLGDIILLEPGDDLIAKLIAKITKSPVCHAALSCGKAETAGNIIEETPPNALKGTLLNRTARTAYVMRLQSGINDLQPVMDIATNYVSQKLPYDYLQLPFIGVYCIAYDLSEGNKLQGLVARLIKLAMGVLIEIENNLIYKGKGAMMCSQFAYHCYIEAGEDYEIHMKKDKIVNLLDKIIGIITKNPLAMSMMLTII